MIGYSRRDYSDLEFIEFLHSALVSHDTRLIFDEAIWKQFSEKLSYQKGTFDERDGYLKLIDKLSLIDQRMNACVPRYFYLATPPDQYEVILNHLHETKLSEGCGQGSDKWTKVLIEKPFGRSLSDAKALDAKLARLFKEEQIYRIDHYLAKEAVQNILAFRYGNSIFEPVWNKDFIDHVQISIAETLGVETRGNFYEGVGALRDMAQSHLLELMAAVAMKEPSRYDADGIRKERARIIAKVSCIQPEEVSRFTVRGQYGKGPAHRSLVEIPSYREEPNVSPFSTTETYVALKLTLNDKRWEGAPFYLRTGKRMAKKATQISVVFKNPELNLIDPQKHMVKGNILTFHIEPEEGITLTLNAKRVGLETVFEQMPMRFSYSTKAELSDAYERLLLDAMKGDQTLFTRTDEVASEWEFISNIISGWETHGIPHFPNYRAGSWGPVEADTLIRQDGREWLLT